MKKSRLLGASFVLCSILSAPSSFAEVVTFNLEFEVTHASDRQYFSHYVGDHFTGSMTYETTTIGTPLSPYSGTAIQYTFNGAPNTLTVDVNSGYSFTNYHYSVHNDAVLSWPPDRITIGASADFPGYENTDFIMEFWSSDGDALPSAALPTEPLILDVFDVRKSGRLSFVNPDNPNRAENMDFHIVSFTAVPIPPALWLFGSGLLGLVGIARKKSK